MSASRNDLRVQRVFRALVWALVFWPLARLVLGLRVRHKRNVPRRGPALVAGNHNSHLDAILLLVALGRRNLHNVRVVAAADYFLRNRVLAWFARRIVGIVPIDRSGAGGRDVLAPISAALDAGHIVVIFPEGTRGDPESQAPFRSGIAHLARRHPEVPIVPVRLDGCGRSLPRGDPILVPFTCELAFGSKRRWHGDKRAFVRDLEQSVAALAPSARLRN